MSDIGRLFATDPLKHTEKDFEAIIAKFRESRNLFNSGVKPATAKKPADPSKKLDFGIDLGDL